jgi:Mrp family chromosome partitioning ATPase
VNPGEILDSPLFDDLLETVRDTYDLVTLDSPPLLSVVDPAALARRSSAILLVAWAGSAKVEALRAPRDVLRQLARRLLGVVLNWVRGFERWAHVGAPLELASRPGGG